MLLGAHQAGVAIEQSMLGATHACANPLTARHGTTHGVAIAVMLPHVVRWNAGHVGDSLRGLAADSPTDPRMTQSTRPIAWPIASKCSRGPAACRRRCSDLGVPRDGLSALAADAATQWTGTFNPRPFDAAAALALYERAF